MRLLSLLALALPLLAADAVVKIKVEAPDGKHTFVLNDAAATALANFYRESKLPGGWGEGLEQTLRNSASGFMRQPKTAPTATLEQAIKWEAAMKALDEAQKAVQAAAKELDAAVEKAVKK